MQVLDLLASRGTAAGADHPVIALGADAARRAAHWLRRPVPARGRRFGPFWQVAFDASHGVAGGAAIPSDAIIHAWGPRAAAAAAASACGRPLLLTLLDPALALEAARWIRALHVQSAVVASTQVGRARLVAAGLSPERTLVIRSPVDFAAITAARRAGLRDRLPDGADPIVLMHGPASRDGGQFIGLWAAAIVRQVHRGLCVILPYASRETLRLRRFARQIGMPGLLAPPGVGAAHWAELAAASDLLLVPAVGEVSAEPIGWAMAAGIPVVGSAVRSIAELIADRHNGLLCRPKQPRLLAARLLTAIEDAALRRTLVDTARGQAYDVFSPRAFLDNYKRLYDNLAENRPPAEGVRDMAIAV